MLTKTFLLTSLAALAVASCGGEPPTGHMGVGDSSPSAPEQLGSVAQADSSRVDKIDYPNATGFSRTYSTNGKVSLKKLQDQTHPFVSAIGTNGRACIHCHQADQGFAITPLGPNGIQARFNQTGGIDPIFRTNDGSNSPYADVSTVQARQTAYSMLLTKGLIRVGIGIPANAEFELAAVDDPYGYASANELSLFRRPLPSTNISVLTAVMWDGRETLPGHSIVADLLDQANGATLGHAQATAGLTPDQRQQIVDFETGLFTAQTIDNQAGDLTALSAQGGPQPLAAQNFYYGINDVLGADPTGANFNPNVFSIYTSWATLPVTGKKKDAQNPARMAVARGEALFNTKPIPITGVKGLNDALGVATLNGTCTTCHDSPNFGHHSVRLPIDIGLTDASRRTADMPLYTLRNKSTGELLQTTDPGRGLITGKWADIGKFKGPILRALASRPPYFHNGFAAALPDVVTMYNTRFNIGFTDSEKADLVAFLETL